MSKWTNLPQEVSRISKVGQKLIGNPLVLITLDSGQQIEGVVRGLSTGNNASSVKTDGRWLYYGNFNLETLDGQYFTIDMTAVQSIISVWAEKSSVYEKAGLISIVR